MHPPKMSAPSLHNATKWVNDNTSSVHGLENENSSYSHMKDLKRSVLHFPRGWHIYLFDSVEVLPIYFEREGKTWIESLRLQSN